MARDQRRLRGRLSMWLGYRMDRFLGLHPALQLGAVLVSGFVLALVFGCAVHLVDHGDGAVPTVGEGLWWAVTRMLDGGTVSSDAGVARRTFGVGITLVGLVAVAFLTGAFATSFAERIRAIRSGTLPILERGHVLLLGYNSRGGVVVRELATSGLRVTVVIVSEQEREGVEERVREQLVGLDHRLRILARRGDPSTIAAVRRAAAHRAEAVVILADGEPASASHADRSVMRSLLALRRVTGARDIPTVIEVSGMAGREMIGLCADRGGARQHSEMAIDARDVNARLLAHAVRQPGAFEVARQILSLDGRSVFLHPGARFAGKTFDAAHASIECGILVGLVSEGGAVVCPDGGRVLERGDRLLVFSESSTAPRPSRATLPELDERASKPRCKPSPAKPIEVLAVRYKPELGVILTTLDEACAARVTLLIEERDAAVARAELARLSLQRIEVETVVGDPLDGGVLEGLLARRRDVALLLAPDVAQSAAAEADADQLITLLYLHRHRANVERAVVEVRSPETARLAGAVDRPEHGRLLRTDFVLSREIVGMLLAQEVHMICLGLGKGSANVLEAAYHDIFDSIGAEIHMYPLGSYALGHELPTFAELSASARKRGEIALGVAEEGVRPYLLPRREERFEVTSGARLVVLGRPEPPEPRRSAASASSAADDPVPSYPSAG